MGHVEALLCALTYIFSSEVDPNLQLSRRCPIAALLIGRRHRLGQFSLYNTFECNTTVAVKKL